MDYTKENNMSYTREEKIWGIAMLIVITVIVGAFVVLMDKCVH